MHTVKSRSSSKKEKKCRDENDARQKVSQSVCQWKRDAHSRTHTRESLCELTCLCCLCSDYMSVYLSVYNTYIYSVYSGLKQLTMAQIICSFTVFFQRFYAACFPLHRILCATTRALSLSLPPSLPLPLLTQVLENTIASRHTHIHCKHFRILSVCCCCAAKMFCLLLKWQ